MSPLISLALVLSIGLYGVLAVTDLILTRVWRRFALEVAALLGLALFLHLATGFPWTSKAFGGVSPVLSIGVLFVCTLAGIAAHYFFYLRKEFSWRTFLRPLFITPMVLLPLMGSVQAMTSLEPVQLLSFAFLAFQNGFFWRMVLERARPASQ